MAQVTTIKNILTSKEIAELTDKNHSDVMRDLRKQFEELEIGQSTFASSYFNSQNKKQPMFRLDKEQTLILVSGYSIKLRAKIIKRLNELEDNNQIPKSFSEALLLAGKLQEEKESLQIEIDNQQKMIENVIYNINDELFSLSSVAKLLKIKKDGKVLGRNKFFELLRTDKLLQNHFQNKNRPYQKYINNNVFMEKLEYVKALETTVHITYVTQKGLDYLMKKYKEEL